MTVWGANLAAGPTLDERPLSGIAKSGLSDCDGRISDTSESGRKQTDR